MGFNLFGFEISKKEKEISNPDTNKITRDIPDGSIEHDNYLGQGAGFNNYIYDFEHDLYNDAQWINEYRTISELPDVNGAILDICQEAIVIENEQKTVEVNLNLTDFSENIKKKITEEFDSILAIMNFRSKGYDLFKNFFIDGRLYSHIVVDNKKLKEGIQEINYLDPTKTKKIKENVFTKGEDGVDVISKVNEFFLHDPNNTTSSKEFGTQLKQILKLTPESVSYIHSGIVDPKTNRIKSFLHKSVKSANQLAMLEDSIVVYRIARASEKRVFYIDVGNLPNQKADQYINNIITKFKNKLVFDSSTGKIKDNKNHLSMAEDIFLPRKNGKGTEVSNLDAANNLSDIEDIFYFRKKLYKSLNIPVSRLENEGGVSLGRASEITRDELKFNKYIKSIQDKFSQLFYNLLKVQLVLKQVISEEDWNNELYNINFNFNTDVYFTEMKHSELLEMKLNLLDSSDQYTNKYFSTNYIKKNILKLTDEEIEEIDKEIIEDKTKYKEE